YRCASMFASRPPRALPSRIGLCRRSWPAIRPPASSGFGSLSLVGLSLRGGINIGFLDELNRPPAQFDHFHRVSSGQESEFHVGGPGYSGIDFALLVF